MHHIWLIIGTAASGLLFGLQTARAGRGWTQSDAALATGLAAGLVVAAARRRRDRRLHHPGQLSPLLNVRAASARTTLFPALLAANGSGPRALVITSANPREGKSTAITSLGIALAEVRRKVLLIDADLRNPRLHRALDVPNSWGLSDLIEETTPIDRYPLEGLARPTAVDGLFLLPSGPATAHVIRLLSSPRVKELLSRLRREFDHILIDSPPMLLMPDARILGGHADGVVLVVRAARTTRKMVAAARERLRADGTRVVGAILNDWSPNH